MRVISRPSPNWSPRKVGTIVDTVILHADASDNADASIAWCCDPRSKVSYHTVVTPGGRIYSLVPARHKAWHAGVSEFKGRANVNEFSVGLCFGGNRNDGVDPYPDAQVTAAALYVHSLMQAEPAITFDRITTHRHIARPAGRKSDPKGFDVPDFIEQVRSLR
jgi:N-acetylmuramoyl-L-alanine amidase